MTKLVMRVAVFVNAKILKCYLRDSHRVPHYSRPLHQIRWIVQGGFAVVTPTILLLFLFKFNSIGKNGEISCKEGLHTEF